MAGNPHWQWSTQYYGAPMGQPRPTRAFDPHTGQVYVESVVPAHGIHYRKPSRLSGLASRYGRVSTELNFDDAMTTKKLEKHTGTNVPTLMAFAAESVVQSYSDLGADYFIGMPHAVLKRIWSSARATADAATILSIWKMLVRADGDYDGWAYLEQSNLLHASPAGTDLCSRMPSIGCATCEWLTALTISGVRCSSYDLVDLSELPNLVGLEVSDLSTDVDEHIVRDWGHRAREHGAFSQFRVLIIRNSKTMDTMWRVARLLGALPALMLFGLEGSGSRGPRFGMQDARSEEKRRFEQHAWVSCDNDDTPAQLKDLNQSISLDHSSAAALRICVERTESLHRNRNPPFEDENLDESLAGERMSPPLLSFRLGQNGISSILGVAIRFYRNSLIDTPDLRKSTALTSKQPSCSTSTSSRTSSSSAGPLRRNCPRRPRAHKRLDLGTFFDSNGWSSMPSQSGNSANPGAKLIDMQRSESVTEPAHAFAHSKTNSSNNHHKRLQICVESVPCTASEPATPPPHLQTNAAATASKQKQPMKLLLNPDENDTATTLAPTASAATKSVPCLDPSSTLASSDISPAQKQHNHPLSTKRIHPSAFASSSTPLPSHSRPPIRRPGVRPSSPVPPAVPHDPGRIS